MPEEEQTINPEIVSKLFTIGSMIDDKEGRYSISFKLGELYLVANEGQYDQSTDHAFHYILILHNRGQGFDLFMALEYLKNKGQGNYIPTSTYDEPSFSSLSKTRKNYTYSTDEIAKRFIQSISSYFKASHFDPEIYLDVESYLNPYGLTLESMLDMQNNIFATSDLKQDKNQIDNIIQWCEYSIYALNFQGKQRTREGTASLESILQDDFLLNFSQKLYLLAYYCPRGYFKDFRMKLLNQLKIAMNISSTNTEPMDDQTRQLKLRVNNLHRERMINGLIQIIEVLDPTSEDFVSLIPDPATFTFAF